VEHDDGVGPAVAEADRDREGRRDLAQVTQLARTAVGEDEAASLTTRLV
jgi:hypothetical protein